MRPTIIIYILLISVVTSLLLFTPASFHSDIKRIGDAVVIVSIVTSLGILGINKKKLYGVWSIGLLLLFICLTFISTGVKYHEDIGSYSWRIGSIFRVNFELNTAIFQVFELINIVCIPAILLLDLYIIIKMFKSYSSK